MGTSWPRTLNGAFLKQKREPMSEQKFTPGPWQTSDYDGYEHIVVAKDDGCELAIAVCLDKDVDSESAKANAKLIARAPQLLAALKRVVAEDCTGCNRPINKSCCFHYCKDEKCEYCDSCYLKLIAKAKGEE